MVNFEEKRYKPSHGSRADSSMLIKKLNVQDKQWQLLPIVHNKKPNLKSREKKKGFVQVSTSSSFISNQNIAPLHKN